MPLAGVAPAPRALADTRRATMAKTIVGALAPLVAARARARDGVVIVEETVGRGVEVLAGVDVVKVNYTVALASSKARVDSAKFFVFGVGAGEVVEGFDAIVGGDGATPPMRVGGARKAVVPAALAYGDRGAGCDKTGNACSIPPGEDLEFTVELLEVK
jgi:peptidylprolyl isomerase